jgi:hypothetical protein
MATIDWQDISKTLSYEQLQRQHRLGLKLISEWKRLANQMIPQGRGGRVLTQYKKGIQMVENTAERTVIELVGMFPNMFEQGLGAGGVGSDVRPFDLRLHVLRKAVPNKVHPGKNGLYANVPFEHTLGSISAAAVRKKTMSTKIKTAQGMTAIIKKKISARTAAERLKATTTEMSPQGERITRYGERLEAGFADVSSNVISGQKHATDILHGVIRMEKGYAQSGETGVQHRSFRRISQGGKPWMSKGIPARNVARILTQRIPDIMEKMRRGGLI